VCKLITLLHASWLAAKELPPCPQWLYVPEIFIKKKFLGGEFLLFLKKYIFEKKMDI
jgi:hypothetical protein